MPTRTVDFFDTTHGINLGTASLSGGMATLSTSLLAVGNDTIEASYSGDADFQATLASTSISASIPVSNATSNVALQADTESDALNAVAAVNAITSQSPPITVTLTLAPGTYQDLPCAPPAGVTLDVNGTVVDGGDTVTIYGGSPAVTVGGSGNVVVQNVILTTSTAAPTVLVNSGNVTLIGDDLQSTGTAATVISQTGGSLTLQDDTVQSTGDAETDISSSGGTLDLGTPSDPGGNLLIAAAGSAASLIQISGSGSVSSYGNTSEAAGSPVPSLVADLTAAPDPTVDGQQATFTATVQGVSGGGTVQFYVDGSSFGQAVATDLNGQATLATPALAVGTHTVTAVFQGSGGSLDFGPVTQIVNGLTTSTTLAAASAAVVYGSPVTFTATVSPAPPDGELVTFTDGSTTLGTAPLMSGTASFTTTTPLSLGTHVIRATYNGDGTYLPSSTAIAPNSIITTVAGGGNGDGGPAGIATVSGWNYEPGSIAVDPAGNTFIVDSGTNRVREINAETGIITTVAGDGSTTYNGDGIPATLAGLNPVSVAVVPAGVLSPDELLLIADMDNNRVREVDLTTGLISTVAGSGGSGPAGDGGAATVAELLQPMQVAVDGAGHLFIADQGGMIVREVNLTANPVAVPSDVLPGGELEPGEIATVAFAGQSPSQNSNSFQWGGFGWSGVSQGFPANDYVNSTFNGVAIAVDASGNYLFVGALGEYAVGVIDLSTGRFVAAATNGPSSGFLISLAVDSNDNLFVAYPAQSEEIAEYAAVNRWDNPIDFYDEATINPTTNLPIEPVQSITTDSDGDVYAAESNVAPIAVQELSPAGAVLSSMTFSGDEDGEAATSASIGPADAVTDPSGNVLIADCVDSVIREVDASTGQISTVAGNWSAGFSGDGGPATDAALSFPSAIAMDENDDLLFVVDSGNGAIREVNLSTTAVPLPNGVNNGLLAPGQIATILGGPSSVDGVSLSFPPNGYDNSSAIAYDQNYGILYVGDNGDNRILAYNPSSTATATLPNGSSLGPGAVAVVAGDVNGMGGYTGDGGPATGALLYGPAALAVDAAGNVYFTGGPNEVFTGGPSMVREINRGTTNIDGTTLQPGDISTIAGNGTAGYCGDGGLATAAELNDPQGLAVDSEGNLYISDTGNSVVREVYAGTGQIATVAGLGIAGIGDGGAAIDAQLTPWGLSFDSSGDLLISTLSTTPDNSYSRVREILSGEQVTVQAGTTTTISGPANSQAVSGEPLTFTATVAWDEPGSPPAAPNAAPTGIVEFIDQTTGAVLGTASLTTQTATSSTGSFTTSALCAWQRQRHRHLRRRCELQRQCQQQPCHGDRERHVRIESSDGDWSGVQYHAANQRQRGSAKRH